MTMQALAGPASNIEYLRKQELDRYGTPRTKVSPIRGVISTYYNFGAANLPIDVLTLATLAPGAVRGRVVAISIYNAGACNSVILDGAAGSQIFPLIYGSAQGNIFISKTQLGDGGLIFTSTINVNPTANNMEIAVFWIPEYDTED